MISHSLFPFSISDLISSTESPACPSCTVSKLILSIAADMIDLFEVLSLPDPGTAVTSTNQDGNAGYRTVSNITNGAFSAETGNSAKVVDLSNAIFSISYQGNTYNLFGPETEGDDLIVISDDVATVSGKYSVQSLNNELNGQKYITVRSDLYDYQYDHNSATDPNYTYTYRKTTRIVFTNNKNWGQVLIH